MSDRVNVSRRTIEWLLEARLRVDLEMDADEPVSAIAIGQDWYVVGYYDGAHGLGHYLHRVDLERGRFIPELEHTDEFCAGCSDRLGEGAYYEPGDRSAGVPRGWEGCELCIAHAAGEAEGSRADYWANVAEDRRAL